MYCIDPRLEYPMIHKNDRCTITKGKMTKSKLRDIKITEIRLRKKK